MKAPLIFGMMLSFFAQALPGSGCYSGVLKRFDPDFGYRDTYVEMKVDQIDEFRFKSELRYFVDSHSHRYFTWDMRVVGNFWKVDMRDRKPGERWSFKIPYTQGEELSEVVEGQNIQSDFRYFWKFGQYAERSAVIRFERRSKDGFQTWKDSGILAYCDEQINKCCRF